MSNILLKKIFLISLSIVIINIISVLSYANGWENVDNEWYYKDNNGDYIVEVIKKSDDDMYYLDEHGKMAKDYLLVDYNDNTYYFGKDGKMVKDTWVAVDPKLIDDDNENEVLAYWYYFQNNGRAFRAKEESIKKTTIDGKSYIFNDKGQLQTGFIGVDGTINLNDEDYPYKDTIYYADVYGVLKKGWVKYGLGTDDERHEDKEELYLYFSESNYKKVYAESGLFKEKIINGKKYAFDNSGIMLSAWDYYDEYHKSTNSNIKRYYGQENDGAMMKKGWVYTVPSEYLCEKDYADETPRYFYFGNNGDMVTAKQKKIDGKYYVFDDKGIMKTGLVVFKDGVYENYIDIDYTSVEMLAKYGSYYASEEASNKGILTYISTANDNYEIKYYGDDGARKTGKVSIDFVDDTAIFVSDNKGAYSGKKKSNYYSNGILLKAKTDCKYGIAINDDKDARECYEWRNDGNDDYTIYYYDSSYDLHAARILLLTTTGKVKKKGVYKDKDDNYWVVNEKGIVKNVFNVRVKERKLGDVMTYMYEDDKNSKDNVYLYFNEYGSVYYNYCMSSGEIYDSNLVGSCNINIVNGGNHQVMPQDDYILNFSLE